MIKLNAFKIYWIALAFISLVSCVNNKPLISAADSADMNATKTSRLSIVELLKEKKDLPIDEKVALYYKLKNENTGEYTFKDELQLTLYGYSFLWANKVDESIEIFKLIIAEFPNSSNAYDNLAEAYLTKGNKELALEYYGKALALNPDNMNAQDQVERIKFPGRVPEKPAEKFAKIFTAEKYKEDLNQLGNTLIRVHPNALKFISKEAFWKAIEMKKALITDNTTYGEFAWHCSEIIANINCWHTNMGSFYYEAQMLPSSLQFPIQTRWVNNQLFVIDPLASGKNIKVKDEIVTINGVAVSDIVKKSYNHIPSQGYIETTKKHFFNNWSTAMIPYALEFPKDYVVKLKGKDQPVVLTKSDKITAPFYDQSIERCTNNLCLQFIDSNETAILTVSSFVYYRWSNFEVFKDFIDSSFKEINNKAVKNLVIDLRFNGGGSQSASIHLLKYLLKGPFTYYSKAESEGKQEPEEGEGIEYPFKTRFKGKSYYLIDGIGNSTTGHFMSIIKYLKVGTIVGEELGSNQFCSAGSVTCRLANTKLEYYVANNTHESLAISLPDETGILPDYPVFQNIDEYVNKVDAVKNYTLQLIKNNSNSPGGRRRLSK